MKKQDYLDMYSNCGSFYIKIKDGGTCHLVGMDVVVTELQQYTPIEILNMFENMGKIFIKMFDSYSDYTINKRLNTKKYNCYLQELFIDFIIMLQGEIK